MYREINQNYLYHFGIKGQRWGIRKYQEEDGSLTPAGEKRYGVGEGETSFSRGAKKETRKQDKTVKKESKNAKKEIKKQEKADLKQDVKQYRSKEGLKTESYVDKKTGETKHKIYDSRGKEISQDRAKKIVQKSNVKTVATVTATAATVYVGVKVVSGLLGAAAANKYVHG